MNYPFRTRDDQSGQYYCIINRPSFDCPVSPDEFHFLRPEFNLADNLIRIRWLVKYPFYANRNKYFFFYLTYRKRFQKG